MKKILCMLVCFVLILLAFGAVAVLADDAETEYVYSYNEALSFAGDGEGQTVIYSTIIGGGIQNGEFATYVLGEGDFSANFGEYNTFVMNGENIQGVLLQTENVEDDMVTVNCASVIAPAVSIFLVAGTLVGAWGLKKKRDDRENL